MNQFSMGKFFVSLGFFIYGLKLVQEGLGTALAERFRYVVHNFTRTKLRSFVSGFVMTIMLQSSQGTNITLIGFVNVSIMSLYQAVPMSLGADLGTALLVLFFATTTVIDISSFAMVILVGALVVNIVFPRRGRTHYKKFVLGLGLVLFGLTSLSSLHPYIQSSNLLREIITMLADEPIFACIAAAILSAFLQSSAVVLGLIITMSSSGIFDLSESIPFVAGANLGGIVSPIVASLRAGIDGKRMASLHAIFKITGVALLMMLSSSLAILIPEISNSIPFQIALAHIILNSFIALVFLPITSWTIQMVLRYVKEHPNDKKFESKYLDKRALETPTVAFANVHRELLRMTEVAQDMFRHLLVPFEEATIETAEYIDDLDDKIDLLNREIKFYLAKLNQSELSDAEGKKQVELMMLTNSIESIGDVISNDIMLLASKKRRMGLVFSKDGWKDIKEFHRKVMDNFQLAVTCLASGDFELGQKALRNKKLLAQYEQELGQKHLMRLHQGHRESFDTSSIHLDLLSSMRRINSVICTVAYPVLDRRHA
ncbi:MAG: Na/Pi cotransporter family protein [Bdellovibrionales bacterium]|nr:Na/Pi cotransporter family protein [Bdellovibrionales bacterium]